ncbi:bifunctional D-altronate/D-mannonate dehydratase [Devosia sp. Leaf420]|uniref:D-mannonate dehydratase ManD n=1 Tax=Devosia sp. Leaf420 TaxID=1736374 RepID=UPI0007124632|nr:D-mannonate dehydratase ManD [Devosia sp. Leaf420]KQT47175.1 bifunctional D-altronate/D-mannonate dehydratase [Devosia sp. Leaf420]
MKITEIKIIVASPGRNFVTVKIMTDQGLYGIGDATVNGREKAVVAYLEDHVVPCLIGRDPMRSEDIWQYLYKGAYWRRGPITMAAISGIDMALWDIKAKAANMPLYQLIGGRSRDKVMVYKHASGMEINEVVEGVLALKEQGLDAIRAQVAIPGLPPIYGTGPSTDQAAGGMIHPLPNEEVWATHKYLPLVPKLFSKLRDAVGWDVHLLHDVHHRLTPIEAARLGKDLEPYRLFWLEDAIPAELQEGFRLFRQHTTQPIAVGEVFNSIYDTTTLIAEQLIDYIRVTSVHAGGVTGIKKIFDFAAIYHIRSACHGPMDVSPVAMGCNIHVDTAIPNFGIQEFSGYTDATLDMFPRAWTYERGYLQPGEAPGHGVDIDEAVAARHPYEPAYLPVARLEDGTLTSW